MKIVIAGDYESMSEQTAAIIVDTIRRKPNSVLCLAAGDTPRRAYEIAAQKIKNEKIDTSECRFVSLDEWVGIDPSNPGSCQYFLRTTLFDPLNISGQQVHLFNALSTDLDNECRQMDEFVNNAGGIDLMVVGVGRNGHIGFNEPGVPFNLNSHVVDLDNTTQTVGQKYFQQETKLTQGITLGLNHLLEARQVVLIANGLHKSQVIAEALEGKVETQMPASIVQQHSNCTVLLDEAAASLLSEKTRSRL